MIFSLCDGETEWRGFFVTGNLMADVMKVESFVGIFGVWRNLLKRIESLEL
jgi:hypothetical protein